ncbi:nuclear transport factor 2 family protein [Mycobacterium aquaticum]|uniref:nuclear transport factor 2 family protein n=1 Tax=Mycobacterium aquaticum TaxID=1927124 RepID=UPI001301E914|nr:nuclear transport factor 2 family protein [Mycobacterium aquaticum]
MDIFKSQAHTGLVLRDVDAFVAHFAPDCVLHDTGESEPRVGREALREWVTAYLESMSDADVEYLTLFSAGEFVLAEFVIRGMYQGTGAGPSGTRVALQYCVIDQIRDGLVLSETVYGVPQQLDRQLSAPIGFGGSLKPALSVPPTTGTQPSAFERAHGTVDRRR